MDLISPSVALSLSLFLSLSPSLDLWPHRCNMWDVTKCYLTASIYTQGETHKERRKSSKKKKGRKYFFFDSCLRPLRPSSDCRHSDSSVLEHLEWADDLSWVALGVAASEGNATWQPQRRGCKISVCTRWRCFEFEGFWFVREQSDSFQRYCFLSLINSFT